MNVELNVEVSKGQFSIHFSIQPSAFSIATIAPTTAGSN